MSTEVVVADASATVAQAAGLMSSRNISCVVVMRQQDAVGIMTEKDVLKRVVALHRDPGTTPVAEVMTHPIVALAPTHSILCASRMMDRMRIHRLVVKENKQVYGIVSQTDILDAVRRELEQIREAQLRREEEVTELTESTVQNLSAMESLVRETFRALRAARRAVGADIAARPDLGIQGQSLSHRPAGSAARGLPRRLRQRRLVYPHSSLDCAAALRIQRQETTCSAEARSEHDPAGTDQGPTQP